MLLANRSQLARNTVVAALVGSACGALAGVWSVYRMPSVRAPVVQPQMTTEVISSSSSSSPPRKKAAEPIPVRVEAQPASASPAAVPASSLPARALNAPVAASALPAVNAQQVLERARGCRRVPRGRHWPNFGTPSCSGPRNVVRRIRRRQNSNSTNSIATLPRRGRCD